MKLSDEKQTFDGKFKLVNSYDRVDIMTPEVNPEVGDDLNVYRSWGAFGMPSEPIREPNKDEKLEDLMWAGVGNKHFLGTKSLFNNSNAVGFNLAYQVANNAPLIDTQAMRANIRQRGDCSIKELVRASEDGEMGREIYNYSDFMYCKYLGRISNNYLVTLRRFPFPCGDHINYTFSGKDEDEYSTQKHAPDIGRLVTWMGTPGNDMNGILKYKVLMPYVEQNAEIQELQPTAESGGIMGSILNLSSGAYVDNVLKGITGSKSIQMVSKATGVVWEKSQIGISNAQNAIRKPFGLKEAKPKVGKFDFFADPPPNEWAYHRDTTKPYGPVDVISKTHRRADGKDGGLTFEQNINLVFDYELKSYDGINTKSAFLDLLANILAVTYTNGKFWGGAYRQTGPSQSNLFANLPIYNMKSPVTFNSVVGSVFDTLGMVTQQFNNGRPISSFKDVMNAAKNLLGNAMNVLVGGALNALGRPQKQALNSLLNEAPVGLWHLTIGNPKHPIMSMGNMILDNVEIEHYGPLGLDDFPTGLKVTISLKHGKPRDMGQIEQMYMMGDYRIYHPMGKWIRNMYESATDIKNMDDYERTVTDKIENELSMPLSLNSSDHQDSKVDNTRRLYTKYFGIDETKPIVWAGMEAHLGSNKAKTAEQADKEQKEYNDNRKKFEGK